MTDRWSLGVLLGLPLALLGISVLLASTVGLSIWAWRQNCGWTDWVLPCIAGFLLVFAIGLTAVLEWPYETQYHRWTHQSGTVTAISSRLLGQDRSTTQRFVVKFGDGRERSCDDTRCSLLKPGDSLDLSCKRAYQWSGTPGWDCNYVQSSEVK